MSDVKWLFEADPIDIEETERMRAAVRELGLECKDIKTIQLFSGLGDLYPDNEDTCVFFFGSLQMARKIVREKKWRPGAFLTLENYRCEVYYPHMERFLFNTPYTLLPLDQALATKEELEAKYGGHGCLFIRPDSGFKTFTGQVFEMKTMQEEFEKLMSFYDFPASTKVLVSSPKDIKNEYRIFVVDGAIVAASRYRKNRKLDVSRTVPGDVHELVYEVMEEFTFRPDPAWVIDVCEDSDGKLWILEIGSISCCGIYGAKAKAIVEGITNLLRKTSV